MTPGNNPLLSPQQISVRQAVGQGLLQTGLGAQARSAPGALSQLGQTLAGALILRNAGQAQTQRNQAANQALMALMGGQQPAGGVMAGQTPPIAPSTGSGTVNLPAGIPQAPQVAPGGGPGGAPSNPLAQTAGAQGAPQTASTGALGALAGQTGPSAAQLLQVAQQFPQLAGVLNPMIAARLTPQKPTVLSPGQVAVGPGGQVIARGAQAPVKGQSPLGKLIADRDELEKRLGANAPQVRALNAAIRQEQSTDPEVKLTDIAGLRKEFQSQSRGFKDLRDSFRRINAAPDTGAGDIALIYSFIRLQSPGIVSDREADLVASTGGAGDRIRLLWERWNSGERLTEGQREDLKGAAREQFRTTLEDQILLEDEFSEQATLAGISPDRVVIDFLGDNLRQQFTQPQPNPTQGGGGAGPQQFTPEEFQAMDDADVLRNMGLPENEVQRILTERRSQGG